MRPVNERVSTVVLLVMENRSFDHMLGHLKLENIVPDVNGLEQDFAKYENVYKGAGFRPFDMEDTALSYDLPHGWQEVATQLASSAVTGQYDMTGFVEAYAHFTNSEPVGKADPMGFFRAASVPITSFLARNFCTCDRWHCPLPADTQPNRTMAFCGSSGIFTTAATVIPTDDMLFDWLQRTGIRWRVYHDGLSFFALYPHAWKYVLSDRFRDFEYMFHDMLTESPDIAPQVIIIEPSYNDGPHIGSDHPNDNHPPLAIGWGEEFLRRVYQAVTVNSLKWSKTVMVHYYDEHGGFYDHVPPPRIPYTTTGNPAHKFESLGPRIPGIVVSPLVPTGSVCRELFDHTSVLQMLAEVFTPGTPYSGPVDLRRQGGIVSLSKALGDTLRADIPAVPTAPIAVSSALGGSVTVNPRSELEAAFDLAASQMMASEPDAVAQKYPELFQWKASVDAARRQVVAPAG